MAIYKQRQGMLRQNRSQKSTPVSLPAPVKGWNTIASLADMDPQEASSMTNFLPGLGFVRLRKGYQRFAQGVGTAAVQTLAEYWSGTTHKLLGASSSSIYDTTNIPTYIVNAVKFDGTTTYLLRGGPLTGIADGTTGSFSVWIQINGGDSSGIVILNIQDLNGSGIQGLHIDRRINNTFQISAHNSAGTLVLEMDSNSQYKTSPIWINILASWNLATGATNLYINGVNDNNTVTVINSAIDYTKTDTSVGANTDGAAKFNGGVSELWFDTSYIDFSQLSNRNKFLLNNVPVNLGVDGSTPTGSKPLLYLNNSAASFQNNNGSGGNFSVTGMLTNASTTPDTSGLTLGTGFTNGRWQTAMFLSNLFFCNGSDTPQVYNGTSLANWTGNAVGLTPTAVYGSNIYRNRLWVWQKNAQSVWYSATDTIGGTYTQFNLYDVGFFGGNLIGCATFTHDGGNGPDDYICFVMSSGQVLVYSGDPASTFSIVGVFQTGLPLDVRTVTQFGGDVLIGTVNDYVLLSQILSASYIPSKVSGAVQTAAALYASNTGWQTISWSKGALLLVNIPTTSATFDQHVFNTVTGAWTRYTNIPSYCWCVFNGDLYFGAGDGCIYKAETGNDDNGAVISGDVTQAFSSLGVNGRMLVRGYRPVIQADGALTYNSGISYDFQTTPVTQTTSSVQSGPFWNQTPWNTSLWGQAAAIIQDWKTGFGRGYQAAVRLVIQTSDQNVYWYRTDFLIEPGGPI